MDTNFEACRSLSQNNPYSEPDRTLFPFIPKELASVIYSYSLENMNELHKIDAFKLSACSAETFEHIKNQIEEIASIKYVQGPDGSREVVTYQIALGSSESKPPVLNSIDAVFDCAQKIRIKCEQPHLTNYKAITECEKSWEKAEREKTWAISEAEDEETSRWIQAKYAGQSNKPEGCQIL